MRFIKKQLLIREKYECLKLCVLTKIFITVSVKQLVMSDDTVSISEMMDNMADSELQQAKKVDCPIERCSYSWKPESVSGHVSASSQSDHIWANTKYDGWKHFNEVMREKVAQQVKELNSKK